MGKEVDGFRIRAVRNRKDLSGIEFRELQWLYSAYCDGLRGINGGPLPGDDRISDFGIVEHYLSGRRFVWRLVMDGDRFIGFLLTCRSKDLANVGAGFEITESFVLPQYRRRGIMTKLVTDVLSNEEGRCLMLVLKRNLYAFSFWRHLFRKAGWHAYYFPRPKDLDGDILLLGWER